jgi:O-antigen ligase
VKWVGLVSALLGALLLSGWLRQNKHDISKVLTLMGFLPFAIGAFHLYLGVISWPGWPGYVKGAEFSVLDALAIALYLALPPQPQRLPFRLPMAIYFTAVLLSAFQATAPPAALFYAWQLLRTFLVYSVVVRACAFDARGAFALLKGMGVGLAMEALVAVWERGHGEVQATGTLGHQNLLGLMSHFVVFPAFALLLSGHRGRAPAAITLTGLIASVLTTSRASVGLAAASYVAVFLVSATRKWTARKARVLLAGIMMLVVVTPIVVVSFQHRFDVEGTSDYDERAAFLNAAQMMLADRPVFGVGANSYVTTANIGGYYDRAGVAPSWESRSANVHNVYALVAAETGYFGLIAFFVFLLAPLQMAIRYSWRHRHEERGDLLLGLSAALLTVYVHSAFEWVFVTFNAQYLFAFDIGLVVALAQAPVYSPLSQLGVGQVTALPTGFAGRYQRGFYQKSPAPGTANDRSGGYN